MEGDVVEVLGSAVDVLVDGCALGNAVGEHTGTRLGVVGSMRERQ